LSVIRGFFVYIHKWERCTENLSALIVNNAKHIASERRTAAIINHNCRSFLFEETEKRGASHKFRSPGENCLKASTTKFISVRAENFFLFLCLSDRRMIRERKFALESSEAMNRQNSSDCTANEHRETFISESTRRVALLIERTFRRIINFSLSFFSGHEKMIWQTLTQINEHHWCRLHSTERNCLLIDANSFGRKVFRSL
jgi:hypothetical protein